jgi:hypothetical protein
MPSRSPNPTLYPIFSSSKKEYQRSKKLSIPCNISALETSFGKIHHLNVLNYSTLTKFKNQLKLSSKSLRAKNLYLVGKVYLPQKSADQKPVFDPQFDFFKKNG